MKSINILQKIFFLLICLGIFSCSNDPNETGGYAGGEKESYISTSLGTLSLPTNLKCDMHIFWKSTGDTNYTFKQRIPLTGSQTKMKFMNNELVNKDYRFLFVATSDSISEIKVTNLLNDTLTTSDKWDDVKISADSMLLSADNYSGVLDKTGNDILNGGSIDGVLTRMVGQIVLDIFKIDGSISTPADSLSSGIESVLDRVYKIDMEYTGITKDVIFDSSNNIIDNSTWPGNHVQTLNLTINPSDLKVTVPQTTNGLEVSPIGGKGSVRMKGIYCLPSDENMRMKFTFYYYDTTPTCGNSDGGIHTTNCYEKKTLVLNLPQDNPGATLLSVYPNYFTVNKAGIRLDRIIDLEQPGSFELLTIWDN